MIRETVRNADSNAILFFGFLFATWVVLLLYRAGALWILALFGVLLFAGWLLERLGLVGNESEAGDRSEAATVEEEDPVRRLKRRYADGDISEEEFEQRLDRLLETDERLDSEAAERSRELEFER